MAAPSPILRTNSDSLQVQIRTDIPGQQMCKRTKGISVTHPQPQLYSLLLKNLLLMLSPDVHELARLVDLHGVIHKSVHVDELHAPLLRVVHHGRDDG